MILTEQDRERVKRQACELAGRILSRYMIEGNYVWAACAIHPKSSPFGLRALRGFPPDWYESVTIPGYVVERVGEFGLRIY